MQQPRSQAAALSGMSKPLGSCKGEAGHDNGLAPKAAVMLLVVVVVVPRVVVVVDGICGHR